MSDEDIQRIAAEAQARQQADAALQRRAGLVALAERGIDATAESDDRQDLLIRALHAGADDATLRVICDAIRVAPEVTIRLPAGRYAGLSRGRDWCRMALSGENVQWGERHPAGGFTVGPGVWNVGSTDGFARKDDTQWTVRHIAVGGETWTVAD